MEAPVAGAANLEILRRPPRISLATLAQRSGRLRMTNCPVGDFFTASQDDKWAKCFLDHSEPTSLKLASPVASSTEKRTQPSPDFWRAFADDAVVIERYFSKSSGTDRVRFPKAAALTEHFHAHAVVVDKEQRSGGRGCRSAPRGLPHRGTVDTPTGTRCYTPLGYGGCPTEAHGVC